MKQTNTPTVRQLLLGAISIGAVTLNLLFWTLPVVVVVMTRSMARSATMRQRLYLVLDKIYRAAVHFHSFWIKRVLGIDFIIHGHPPADTMAQLIVVSNHRSWFDILVLHMLVTDHGPIIKFLIKRELIYVPVVGWLCLALNFPRLRRGRDAEGREKDYRSIMTAANELSQQPGALLNFAEGTRFTPAKHARQQSPWQNLLKPKTGGMKIMLETMRDTEVLDCTLVYPDNGLSFWACMGGALKSMEVYLDYFPSHEIEDVARWLDERWRLKDERIEHSTIRTRPGKNS